MQLIAMKQRVGRAKADEMALPTLIFLDSAARGKANIAHENSLVKLVVINQVIGSKSGNRAFYDIAIKAGQAMLKACSRQAELLSFTTGEYQAVRKMVVSYLRILPTLEVSMLAFACTQAEAIIASMARIEVAP